MAASNTTVLTRKGQTTIPVEVREKLGLKEGDRLIWWEVDGEVRLMEARAYTERMIEHFRARADRSRPPVTIEEMKEAAAAGWTERYKRLNEQE